MKDLIAIKKSTWEYAGKWSGDSYHQNAYYCFNLVEEQQTKKL